MQNLTAGYDRTMVLRELSLAVNAGQTAVVIGPNGHGKTTLLLAISGLLKPSGGTIEFDGRRIDGTAAEALANRGIVHILQGDGLFPDMTVEENLLLGAFVRGSWRGRRTPFGASTTTCRWSRRSAGRRRARCRAASGGWSASAGG